MAVAVGGWVVGAVGGAVAGSAAAATAAFTVSSMVAGMIGGLVVGATIGAITSLVTGGDLGKGILFGAIGGAVAGGISGYFAAGTTTVSSAASSTPVTSPFGWESTVADGGSVVGSSGGQTVTSAVTQGATEGAFQYGIKEIGSNITEKFSGSAVEGVINLLGKGMEGHAAEEMAAQQAEWQSREAALDRQHAVELAKIQADSRSGGSSDGSAAAMYSADQQYKAAMAKIAEERRQFNEQMRITEEDRSNRKKALQQFRTVRQADSVQGPSILDQTTQDVQENTPPLVEHPTGDQTSNLQQYSQQEEAYA